MRIMEEINVDFLPEQVLNSIGLFAGYGGIELGIGLVEPNLRACCLVERDFFAIANLAKKIESGSMDECVLHSDVRSFDGRPWRGKIHLVCGGIECQPWSVAGQQRGIEDERWLWPEAYRIIREVEPTYVFLEEVFGFIRGGLGFVYRDLAESGYCIAHDHFRASDVGAPHRRERLFILARKLAVPFRLRRGGWSDGDNPGQEGEIQAPGSGSELGDPGYTEHSGGQEHEDGGEGEPRNEPSSSGGDELGISNNQGPSCTRGRTQHGGPEFVVGDTIGEETRELGDASSVRLGGLCPGGGGTGSGESEGGMCEPPGAGCEGCPMVDAGRPGTGVAPSRSGGQGRQSTGTRQPEVVRQGHGASGAEGVGTDGNGGMADAQGGMPGEPAEQEGRQDTRGGGSQGLQEECGETVADIDGEGLQGHGGLGECADQLPSCPRCERYRLPRSIWPARPKQFQYEWEPPRIILADSHVAGFLEPRTEQQADGVGQLPQEADEDEDGGELSDVSPITYPEAETTIGGAIERCTTLLRILYTAAFYAPTQVLTGLPLEPTLVRDSYGTTSRMDELRLIGNGVLPMVSSIAWVVLKTRLLNFIGSQYCPSDRDGDL